MHEFLVPSPWAKKQRVIVSDDMVTVLEKPKMAPTFQVRLDELVNVAFVPAKRFLGQKKIGTPRGSIRLSRSWADQRLGSQFPESDSGKSPPQGIYFGITGEKVAFELHQHLMKLFEPHRPSSPYLAQVEFDRFALSITEDELIFTHREAAANFASLIKSSLKAGTEVRCLLSEAPSLAFAEASSDKLFLGAFSGDLSRDRSATGLLAFDDNPWSVSFPANLTSQIGDFVEVLTREVIRAQKGVASGLPIPASGVVDSMAKQISDLHTLVISGALSQEEFDTAKRKLLR
jgi:hypothetical protein